jgi:arsenate reductase (thioredoxin)
MKEIGIDISSNTTKSIFSLYQQGKLFNYAISLSDEESLLRCPLFPHHIVKYLAWPFEDPEYFIGTYEEKLVKTRKIRDQIRESIEKFIYETSKNVT